MVTRESGGRYGLASRRNRTVTPASRSGAAPPARVAQVSAGRPLYFSAYSMVFEATNGVLGGTSPVGVAATVPRASVPAGPTIRYSSGLMAGEPLRVLPSTSVVVAVAKSS